MIEGKDYIYISPPNTGGQAVRKWLIKHEGGKMIGKSYDAIVPDTANKREITKFLLSVRNPYERCLSMWWWSCMAPERLEKCHLYGLSFMRYMERLIWFRDHLDYGHETPYVYETQSQYSIRAFFMKEGVHAIRYECASHDLEQVFPDEAPRAFTVISKSNRPKVHSGKFLSGAEEAMVWEYCQEDFEQFGYERLPRVKGKSRCW